MSAENKSNSNKKRADHHPPETRPPDGMKQALLTAQAKIKQLEKQLIDAREAADEISVLQKEVSVLKKQESDSRKQIETLSNDKLKLNKQLTHLKQQEKKLGDEKCGLEKLLVELEEKLQAKEMDTEEHPVTSSTSKFRIELYFQEGAIPGRIEHVGTQNVQKFLLHEPVEMLNFLKKFQPVAPTDTVQADSEPPIASEKNVVAAVNEPELTAAPSATAEAIVEPTAQISMQQTPQKISVAKDQPFQINLQLELSDEMDRQCSDGAHEETMIYARSLGSRYGEKLLGHIVMDENIKAPVSINIPGNLLNPGLYRIDSKIDLTPSQSGKKVSAVSDSGLLYIY
ncbi:MAG: hypothetical protein H6696_04460 [Deferribacteres bacterium]|nr:hypothetical protein [Deferribacteres bacterium]